MNGKLTAVALMLCIASMGLGYVLAYVVTTQPLLAPANHESVALSVWVHDDTTDENLTTQYMGGVFSLSMPSLNEFPPGQSYQYSRWELDAKSGVEAFMVVAGPGTDKKTYGIEISRKCWDALTIMVPGGQTFTFQAVTQIGKVSDGYVSFEFIPSFS